MEPYILPPEDDEATYRLLGPRKYWIEEDWRHYRTLPFVVRFIWTCFRPLIAWYGLRELRKIDASIKETKEIGERLEKDRLEARQQSRKKPPKPKLRKRSDEEIQADIANVRELVKTDLEVRGGFIGSTLLFALREGGKPAIEAKAKQILAEFSGDEILKISVLWPPEVNSALAEFFFNDPRFN